MQKMSDSTQTLNEFVKPYLNDVEFAMLFGGTDNSRYSKVKRLIKSEKLIHIRRGLYAIASQREKIHPFEISQRIYGPSYISLQSALAYHRLIPEAVVTITAVTCKRSNQFDTPLGIFEYQHLPEKNFYCQVTIVNNEQSNFHIAKPWKAICDYVYCYKKTYKSFDQLVNDLRIDTHELQVIDESTADILKDYYQHKRLSNFLNMVLEENNVYRNNSKQSS